MNAHRPQASVGEDRGNGVPHVVILGGGFGGLTAAAALANAPVKTTLVDRRNHHLFQPLLYQVATAGLSPAQIAAPVRHLLSRQKNATVLMETVTAIDPALRAVQTCTRTITYDFLIVATGATHAYFGNPQWAEFAPGLKTIEDATRIRSRILTAFERAEVAMDEETRRALLTFVVVGAGPTGVEMAGAIAELARQGLANDFRHIMPSRTRVVLIEAGERVLPQFHEKLSRSAEAQLRKLGVEVITGSTVAGCGETGVTLSTGEEIRSACIVWAAGVRASPAAEWLGARCDRAGRIIVEPDLRLPGRREIMVIGDTAAVPGPEGGVIPALAPAAKQMGVHAARNIRRALSGMEGLPFVYKDHGSLATIGRNSAVGSFGSLRLSGALAWLAWCFLHLWFLVGFRNRIAVFLDWAWSYFTFQRGARLITGGDNG